MKKLHLKNKTRKQKNWLFINTSLIIFFCLVAVLLFFYVLNALNFEFDLFGAVSLSQIATLSIMLIISMVLGAMISLFVSKKLTTPISKIKEATNQIAKGNFDVKLDTIPNSSVNDLIENFNKMARELKSIETLKATFVTDVSHEFKTPLAVIQSYTKAGFKKDIDEETRAKYQSIVETNIQKLINLTSNILSLSKIENQQIVVDKERFLVDEQIRQSILSLEPQWKEKNIEFDLELDEVEFLGPKEYLGQVWQNLIGNAIKFSSPNGKVEIVAKNTDLGAEITVRDFGVGMSVETQKHIFDRFYQGDQSRSSAGNGLGLAIVRKILNLCGASIIVQSELGKGATFVVTLPKIAKK